MKRDLRRLAAPFVLVASAGCTKSTDTITSTTTETTTKATTTNSPTTKPTDDGPATVSPTTTTTTPPDSTALVYDGYGGCYRVVDGEKKYVPQCPESMLPPPPKDQLVYKSGNQCKRVPDGNPVQCPPSGPTAILPDPDSIKTAKGSIFLQYGSLKCLEGEDVKCPPKVNCNPPPPDTVTCPATLMPKLAPGVKPTKIDQQRCWYGSVEVACPKP